MTGERSPLLHHSAKLRLRSSFSPAHSAVGPISEQVIQLVDKRSLIQKFQCIRTSELFPRKPKCRFLGFPRRAHSVQAESGKGLKGTGASRWCPAVANVFASAKASA